MCLALATPLHIVTLSLARCTTHTRPAAITHTATLASSITGPRAAAAALRIITRPTQPAAPRAAATRIRCHIAAAVVTAPPAYGPNYTVTSPVTCAHAMLAAIRCTGANAAVRMQARRPMRSRRRGVAIRCGARTAIGTRIARAAAETARRPRMAPRPAWLTRSVDAILVVIRCPRGSLRSLLLYRKRIERLLCPPSKAVEFGLAGASCSYDDGSVA